MDAPAQRRGEAGYNLVMMIIAITVLNILLAASLPLWSTAIQREKEEELIFRGFQYAEAIRVFQLRFQRPPTRLQELIEIQPRSIRQLWKDPMTEDGKWALLFVGQDQGIPLQPQPPGPDGQQEGGEEGVGEEGGEDTGDGNPSFGPRKGEQVAVGPIRGVRSRSNKSSILTFYGRQRYSEWQFTVEMIPGSQGFRLPQGGGVAPGMQMQATAAFPDLSTRWLGRPLPAVLGLPQPAPPQSMGQPPGVRPPRGNPPGGRPQPPRPRGGNVPN